MNILILDLNPATAARYHVDKDICRMPTKTAQLICNAHHFLNSIPSIPYSPVEVNHPLCSWITASISNYLWLVKWGKCLCSEFNFRFHRTHESEEIFIWGEENIPSLMKGGLSPFLQLVPDKYKNENVVTAYRNYYLGEKRHFFSWKNREIPRFVVQSPCWRGYK